MVSPFFWMLQPARNDEQTRKTGTEAENHGNLQKVGKTRKTHWPVDFTGFVPASIFSEWWAILLLPLQDKRRLITRLSLSSVYNKSAPGTLRGLTCCKPVQEAWTREYIIWSDSCVHRLTLTLFIPSGLLIPSKITWRVIKWGDYCCVRASSRNKPFKPWRK